MKNLKVSNIYLKKKKNNKEIFNFYESLTHASKHITNKIRFDFKRIDELYNYGDMYTDWLDIIQQEHIDRGNKKLTGKSLLQAYFYHEFITQPKHFSIDGKDFVNYAHDYPKNGLQALIKREITNREVIIKKRTQGEKASLPKYITKNNFSAIFSTNDFSVRYYKDKKRTKLLKPKDVEILPLHQRNQLYTTLQLCSNTNKHEIKLEQGMFFVQSIQVNLEDKDTIKFTIIFDDYEQNWHNIETINNLRSKQTKTRKEFLKEVNKLKKSCIKRTYKNNKHISKHKNIMTSIDPGVNGIFTLTTVNVETGESSSAQIKGTEFTQKFNNIDNQIELAKSVKDTYLDTKYIQSTKHSLSASEEENKNKESGWVGLTIKNLSQTEKDELNELNDNILSLWSKRSRMMMDFKHKVSALIVKECLKNKTSTLILGKNGKQEMTGRKWNSIPHFSIYELLVYKARECGIKVVYQQEAYSSKISSLDNEPIKTRSNFLGKREGQFFYLKDGTVMDADVNGALNILRFYYQGRCQKNKTWGTEVMRRLRVHLLPKPVSLSLS